MWVTASEPIEAGETITLQVAGPADRRPCADRRAPDTCGSTRRRRWPPGRHPRRHARSLAARPYRRLHRRQPGDHQGRRWSVPAGVVKLPGITYTVGRDVHVGQVRVSAARERPARSAPTPTSPGSTGSAGPTGYATAACSGRRPVHHHRQPGPARGRGQRHQLPRCPAAGYLGLPILLVQPDGVPNATAAGCEPSGSSGSPSSAAPRRWAPAWPHAIDGLTVGDCGGSDLGIGKIKDRVPPRWGQPLRHLTGGCHGAARR